MCNSRLIRLLLVSVFYVCLAWTPARGASLTPGEHVGRVNGVDLHYSVVGSGPLLIVQAPGWGLGSEYLRQGLAPLQKHFTLVFYDTRGSGQSGRPGDPTRMHTSDMVDDLEGLRRLWHLPALTLLGHSHGGVIALGYAIRYPTRVKTLILVSSGIIDFDFGPPIQQQLEARKGDPRFEDAIAHFSAMGRIETDEELGALLTHLWPLYFYDPDKYSSAFAHSLSHPPSAWVFNKHPEADRSIQEDGAMQAVSARTLVLTGQNDWVCGPTIAERIHTGIAGSQYEVLDKTGHFPWIEAPQEFFAAITRFADAYK